MKIAIKANPDRGKEIISLLESLGGIKDTLDGSGYYYTYYIGENNMIKYDSPPKDYIVYTLEEFETQFPFKIGDEVVFPVKVGCVSGKITGLTYVEDQLKYEVDTRIGGYRYVEPHKLSLYPMKEERNITLTLDKAKEWYKKGGELKEIALQAFTKKELTKVDLPKTWEEFCGNHPIKEGESYAGDSSEIYTHCESNGERDSELDRNMCPTPKSAEAHLAMIQLEQLRDCWRQGWVPDYTKTYKKYGIKKLGTEYIVDWFTGLSDFLVFQTEELAKEFLECFKDLIEQAGDLI